VKAVKNDTDYFIAALKLKAQGHKTRSFFRFKRRHSPVLLLGDVIPMAIKLKNFSV
jgi:UDP-2,3-diacylglucosamine pyrophosphatase LpxH